MAETPNPTLLELADADALVNGDMSLAQDEILRRLQLNMPVEIARKNAVKGWSGPDAIVLPLDYQIAPAELTDDFLNMILVSVSVETLPQGIGGVFRNEAIATIYSIDSRLEAQQQIRVAWARAEAIRASLYPFLSGARDASDRLAWRLLEPKGYAMLTGDWAKRYSGTAVRYRLVQAPQ